MYAESAGFPRTLHYNLLPRTANAWPLPDARHKQPCSPLARQPSSACPTPTKEEHEQLCFPARPQTLASMQQSHDSSIM